MLPVSTQVLADPEAVASEACRLISAAAAEAIRERQVFRLVLAGGGTPRRTYELLARTVQDWPAWEIFWGDERCLPVGHQERNSRMARDAWLGKVAIAARQIHAIPAELGAERAAAAYSATIADQRPFDLVLLGMGDDGHTASLFPGADNDESPVIAVHDAPKAPAERVSLGVQTLRAGRRQLVLITGADKAHAFAAWRRGEALPIARAVNDNACLLLDAASMAQGCSPAR